mgnify:CR=1 FL=1
MIAHISPDRLTTLPDCLRHLRDALEAGPGLADDRYLCQELVDQALALDPPQDVKDQLQKFLKSFTHVERIIDSGPFLRDQYSRRVADAEARCTSAQHRINSLDQTVQDRSNEASSAHKNLADIEAEIARLQQLADEQKKKVEVADRKHAEAVEQRAAEPNPRRLIRHHNSLVAKLRELEGLEQDVAKQWDQLVGESKKLDAMVSSRWPRGLESASENQGPDAS